MQCILLVRFLIPILNKFFIRMVFVLLAGLCFKLKKKKFKKNSSLKVIQTKVNVNNKKKWKIIVNIFRVKQNITTLS